MVEVSVLIVLIIVVFRNEPDRCLQKQRFLGTGGEMQAQIVLLNQHGFWQTCKYVSPAEDPA